MISPPILHPPRRAKLKKPLNKPEKKRKKQPYIDDGHTVYDMSALNKDKIDPTKHVGLSNKEKIAAILAAFECYLPLLLLVIGSFALVMLLINLWLN